MLGAAPLLLTAIALAALAVFRISGISFPFVSPERKYPQNVSPAAVVSTAFTL